MGSTIDITCKPTRTDSSANTSLCMNDGGKGDEGFNFLAKHTRDRTCVYAKPREAFEIATPGNHLPPGITFPRENNFPTESYLPHGNHLPLRGVPPPPYPFLHFFPKVNNRVAECVREIYPTACRDQHLHAKACTYPPSRAHCMNDKTPKNNKTPSTRARRCYLSHIRNSIEAVRAPRLRKKATPIIGCKARDPLHFCKAIIRRPRVKCRYNNKVRLS